MQENLISNALNHNPFAPFGNAKTLRKFNSEMKNPWETPYWKKKIEETLKQQIIPPRSFKETLLKGGVDAAAPLIDMEFEIEQDEILVEIGEGGLQITLSD